MVCVELNTVSFQNSEQKRPFKYRKVQNGHKVWLKQKNRCCFKWNAGSVLVSRVISVFVEVTGKNEHKIWGGGRKEKQGGHEAKPHRKWSGTALVQPPTVTRIFYLTKYQDRQRKSSTDGKHCLQIMDCYWKWLKQTVTAMFVRPWCLQHDSGDGEQELCK